MTKMTVTVLELFAAALTFGTFVRDTHPPIERAVSSNISSFVKVVHATVGKFDLRLVDDILVGPGVLSETDYLFSSSATNKTPNCRPLMTFGVSSMTCSLARILIVSVSLAAIVPVAPKDVALYEDFAQLMLPLAIEVLSLFYLGG